MNNVTANNQKQNRVSEDSIAMIRRQLLADTLADCKVSVESPIQTSYFKRRLEVVTPKLIEQFQDVMGETMASNTFLTGKGLLHAALNQFKKRLQEKEYAPLKGLADALLSKLGPSFTNKWGDYTRSRSLDSKKAFATFPLQQLTIKLPDGTWGLCFTAFEMRVLDYIGRDNLFNLLFEARNGSLLEQDVMRAIKDLFIADNKTKPEVEFILNYKPDQDEEDAEEKQDTQISGQVLSLIQGISKP